MKRTFILLCLVVCPLQAKTLFGSLELNPYLGVEYQYQHSARAKIWRKFMPADFNVTSVFFGNKYHKNFGIELGYYHTLKKSQNSATFADGLGHNVTVFGQMRNKGFSFDWNIYYPLDVNFNLMGIFGLATYHPMIQVVSDRTALGQAFSRISGRNKTIFRPGVGVEYFNKCWGARARILAPFTQELYVNVDKYGKQIVNLDKKAFKQTFLFTVGVFYIF